MSIESQVEHIIFYSGMNLAPTRAFTNSDAAHGYLQLPRCTSPLPFQCVSTTVFFRRGQLRERSYLPAIIATVNTHVSLVLHRRQSKKTFVRMIERRPHWRHTMGSIVSLWMFEDEERSWSDNRRCITQVAKHRPGKEKHQSRSHLHGRRKFPEHSRKGQPGAGTQTGPAKQTGGRGCRRRWGPWLDVVDDQSKVEVVHGGFWGKGQTPLTLSREGSGGARRRRQRRGGEILALGSLGALLPRSVTRDHSCGWQEDGMTSATETDGVVVQVVLGAGTVSPGC